MALAQRKAGHKVSPGLLARLRELKATRRRIDKEMAEIKTLIGKEAYYGVRFSALEVKANTTVKTSKETRYSMSEIFRGAAGTVPEKLPPPPKWSVLTEETAVTLRKYIEPQPEHSAVPTQPPKEEEDGHLD